MYKNLTLKRRSVWLLTSRQSSTMMAMGMAHAAWGAPSSADMARHIAL